MANLYEVDNRLETLLEEGFDIDDGEILDGEALQQRFDEVAITLENKMANIIGYIKNLEADASIYKEESDKLKKRAEQKLKRAEWLRNYLDNYLKATVTNVDKYKFESVQGKISYRKSNSVNILDQNAIPSDYIDEVVTIKPNKKAITDAIKSGEVVDGCELVTKLNMQIK